MTARNSGWIRTGGFIAGLMLQMVALSGCVILVRPDLKDALRENQSLVVVYYGGKVTSRINQKIQSAENTPEDFKAISESVIRTLKTRISEGRITTAGQDDRQPGRGLEVAVLVNGGYFCDGESGEYDCVLVMKTHLLFRSIRTGRIIGERHNLVGEVYYGTHRLFLGGGLTEPDEKHMNRRVDEQIRVELPPRKILNQLISSTETGIDNFLTKLKNPEG